MKIGHFRPLKYQISSILQNVYLDFCTVFYIPTFRYFESTLFEPFIVTIREFFKFQKIRDNSLMYTFFLNLFLKRSIFRALACQRFPQILFYRNRKMWHNSYVVFDQHIKVASFPLVRMCQTNHAEIPKIWRRFLCNFGRHPGRK